MEGSVLSFLKAEWKVSDTGSAHWASSYIMITPNITWRSPIYIYSGIWSYHVNNHIRQKETSNININLVEDSTQLPEVTDKLYNKVVSSKP
jgi:hypothetical protein